MVTLGTVLCIVIEGDLFNVPPPSLPSSPCPLFRRCGPRLSEEAADKLRNRYVMMRSGTRQHERETAKRTNIPITVRYANITT